MRWILLYQDIGDIVAYISSESPETVLYIEYNEFLDFISNYPVRNWLDFKKEVNCFKTIFLNLNSGQWEIKKNVKDFNDFSFDELYKLNKEDPKEKKSFYEKGKEFIMGRKKK